ncbi:hypothetical protein K5D34_16860 [Pseudomonas cichorii]|uniref:Uncharacterized protein n=1 Tax=Pseudomonas lijiangensis TaxID=2995658 RepID=A0ABX8HR93_9PSED|nr:MULTISPECIES: hypothetical protein [Pseudomonas syringae group]MBX8492608.1 hypothetical protein [Pseudomonas cichorii]MBX8501801.1 hypothetical protein [Pseudomonas lijiangensis]MBX8506636.1 hypothetical protein [Pseudomonas lijiangensis]MBX8511360.1 hypothetical protein [Pseudomonas cichorii]MBX8522619.1 hypothetical protein [Pseudomonas cichorii]
MMKSIEPFVALKLRHTAFFAAIWGAYSLFRAALSRDREGSYSIFIGALYKKMNKAKLDCSPQSNKTGVSMPCLPLIDSIPGAGQSGHHARSINVFNGLPSNPARLCVRPDSSAMSSSHTGHRLCATATFHIEQYHYSGMTGVTDAAHVCKQADATLPLIRACRNELYNVTPMRRKNA